MDFILRSRIWNVGGVCEPSMDILFSVQCKKVLGMLNIYLPRRNSTPRHISFVAAKHL